MLLATIGIFVGTLSLLVDLGNRLFGSYARTAFGAVFRILVVTLCCLGMLFPLGWAAYDPASSQARTLVCAIGMLGVALFIHFLFPFRFGIRRERPPNLSESWRSLADGIVLRDLTLHLPSVQIAPERLVAIVLTDLHCNTRSKLELLRESFDALPKDDLDLVVVLGDFGENTVLLPGLFAAIAAIPSRFGCYVVRGNHDCEGGRTELIAELAAENRMELLTNGTASLPDIGTVLLGVERPWIPGRISNIANEQASLALTHTPDNLRTLSRLNVPLVLAGHTHGGKLHVPFIGAVLVPSLYGRFLDCGWFRLRDTWMYLSAGIGYFPTASHPGEIVRLILLSQPPGTQGRPADHAPDRG